MDVGISSERALCSPEELQGLWSAPGFGVNQGFTIPARGCSSPSIPLHRHQSRLVESEQPPPPKILLWEGSWGALRGLRGLRAPREGPVSAEGADISRAGDPWLLLAQASGAVPVGGVPCPLLPWHRAPLRLQPRERLPRLARRGRPGSRSPGHAVLPILPRGGRAGAHGAGTEPSEAPHLPGGRGSPG